MAKLNRGRVSDPAQAALSGSQHKAPGYAGGYLPSDPKAYNASHLISISLDPGYDQPPVLRQYGLAYLDDNAGAFSHWEFADTTPGDLKKLAEAFGLQYNEENNQITHTMATTLIDPDSKVAQTWAGSDWNPDDVASAIKSLALKVTR